MATNNPAPNDNSAQFVKRRIEAGAVYHHIFLDRHPDPLGFGLSPSRFSDPRRQVKHRYGIYYVGATFEVAFLETLVRDSRNQNPGSLVIPLDELDRYVHVPITIDQPLDVVDLRGGNPITMGIPTDAVRARSHRHGRQVSLSLYRHQDRPDGICYSSRLNEEENLAIYDRAVHKLRAGPRRKLDHCDALAPVLDRYRIVMV
jgi:hypothetical protein